MFTDGRSKKVIFLAHCLLNQNAISDGTAVYPAAFRELIQLLLDREVGIVQMPCPELCCLGLDRGDVYGAERPVVVENTRIRRAMEEDGPRQRREALADQVVDQIQEYQKHGFQVLGIVGANRSPNCGVETTSDQNRELEGQGAFLEAIAQRLEAVGAGPEGGGRHPQESGCTAPLGGPKAGTNKRPNGGSHRPAVFNIGCVEACPSPAGLRGEAVNL